uniref:Uncharacterized protein n=1 Tax=Sphaerodactylus townsendi TaxID=933632 RepID=A0ACB8FTJ2_9SAUR
MSCPAARGWDSQRCSILTLKPLSWKLLGCSTKDISPVLAVDWFGDATRTGPSTWEGDALALASCRCTRERTVGHAEAGRILMEIKTRTPGQG